MSSNFFSLNRPFIAFAMSLWALYLRYQNLNSRELWNDEIYQLSLTRGALKPFWQQSSYGDISGFAGDYLLTYPFVQMFDPNKWGMAIPHIAATIIGFFLLYHVCKKYCQTFLGYLIAFSIVAFNENLVFHSFELRPYAVLPTLALGAFLCADLLVNQFAQLSRVKKICIGIFYVLTSWYHAFGPLIVAFPLIFFLLSKKWDYILKKENRKLWQYLLVVGCVAFPVWLYYATSNPLQVTVERRILEGYHTFTTMPNPLDGFWRFFNRAVFYNLIGFKRLYFLLGGLILLIFVPFKGKKERMMFFLINVFLHLEVIWFSVLVSNYWFLDRQYVHLVPLFAVFMAMLWDSAFSYYRNAFKARQRWPVRAIIGLVLMVGCSLGGIIDISLYLLKNLG